MKKLLVLGAGYGGLAVAQRLDALSRDRSQWEVTLVDQRDYHLIQVRVHEVAANSISAERVKIPFSELLAGSKAKLVQAHIEKIEPDLKRVHTSAGVLEYDRLVIALGCVTDYHDVPGLQEYAFSMKSLEDAIAYRRAVIETFKTVANSEEPPLTPDPRLTFIIVGGGMTGTELAAEMVDFCKDLATHYPITSKAYRIILLNSGEHILSQLGTSEGDYVRQELHYRGVKIFTKSSIERVDANTVYIKGNKAVHSNIICWTGGIKAPPIIAESGFEVTKNGRLPVDSYLRTKQYPNVFAIGDNAFVPDRKNGGSIPQTGQYAEKQGEFVAEYLWDEERRIRPHRYTPFSLGLAVSLGRNEALALSGPLRLTGVAGRMAKNASYDNYEWTIRWKPRLLNPR